MGDHALRLLDLQAQKLVHTLRGHTKALTACAFLREGNQGITASMDRTLKLWDLEKGQTVRSIPSISSVLCVAVHQGTGLVSAGLEDGGVALWDPRVSTLQVPTRLPSGRVVGLHMAPDKKTILSQADDGIVYTTSMDAMRPQLKLEGLGPVIWP